MRAKKQIIADLEDAYSRIEKEAQTPARKMPCQSCRFCSNEGWTFMDCHHPLVVGHGEPATARGRTSPYIARLCGPEKALWEPDIWTRLSAWFGGLLFRKVGE